MAKTGSIKITQVSQDIVNMTTTFNVYASITTSGESYRGDHNKFILRLNRDSEYILPAWFDTLAGWTVVKDSAGNRLYAYYTVGVPQNTTKQLCNFDVTLKHYSTGTSGTISASFDYADGWCTASTSTTFPTIQPKSTLTAPSGTLGEELTISVKKNNTRFTHTITYTLGNFVETICQKSSDTTIKWTPPIDLASAFTDSPSGVGRISIETFDGNTSLGSNAYNLTLSVPDTLVPIIDDFYYIESPYFAIGGFAQGKSGMYVTITARGVYGSRVVEYETKVGDTTYYGQYFTTNVFKTPGTITVTCRVKDTRGQYSEPHIFTIDVMEYATPNIKSLTARRCNQNGTYNHQGGYFSVEFEADISPLDGKNEVTYAVGYKKVTETQYKYSTTQAKAGQFIIEADVYSTYDIMLFIEDKMNTITKVIKGYSARRVFDIWKTKFSIAFGKIAELENAFEVLFENIKLTGTTKVSIEGKDIDLVPSGNLLYKGGNFFGAKQIWTGQEVMNELKTITLSKKISEMKNGILLVFARGTYNLTPYFVPKEVVLAYTRTTFCFPLCTGMLDYIGSKTLNISDTKIEGHTDNDATGTNGISGITYHNELFYLVKIYEV